VIEIIGAAEAVPCKDQGAKFLTTREQLDRDIAMAEALRAQLVAERFRFVERPSAMLDIGLLEQSFQAARAQVRAVQHELAQAEDGLTTSKCEKAGADPTTANVTPTVIVEVRTELPTRYMSSLERARADSEDVVSVYGTTPLSRRSDAIATGRLVWVEGAFLDRQSKVIARARLHDPLHQLLDGEIVAVEVQLGSRAD